MLKETIKEDYSEYSYDSRNNEIDFLKEKKRIINILCEKIDYVDSVWNIDII